MIHPQLYAGLPEQKQVMSRLNMRENDPVRIIEIVCEVLKLDRERLLSPLRSREYSEPRFIAIGMIIKTNPKMPLKAIGRLFNRDHSTVIYARETFYDLYGRDKAFTAKVDQVRALL
ncbi:helix-turn-helix domain-containing protein [Pedobacter faecalis]|uniref:helix-turn-helix domain-containing protein n=1 Tax=Pedobacter faecalis TaxID=3041495 RepID=UPI00254CD2AE|nr:helix-turn-helix domain-containing protein [Pedobacter sp. ELA7]